MSGRVFLMIEILFKIFNANRNHGRSQNKKFEHLSYEFMAEDVLQTISFLGLKRVHIIGHSMGGKVVVTVSTFSTCLSLILVFLPLKAAELALKVGSSSSTPLTSSSDGAALTTLPEILSLSILDISPVAYSTDDFRSVIDTVGTLKRISGAFRNESIEKKDVIALVNDAIESKAMQNFIASNLLPCDQDKFRWSFNIHRIHESMTSILDFPAAAGHSPCRYDGPTMILKGSQSAFVRTSHFRAVERLFPNYFLVSVRNAGHWLHVDQPEDSAERVARFLDSVKQFYAGGDNNLAVEVSL
jgi:esterase